MLSAVRTALHDLTLVLYPPTCPSCGAETGAPHGVCPACWREITFLTSPACTACGRPMPPGGTGDEHCDDCLRHPHAWDHGAAAMAYGGTGRRLVLSLKHGDRLDLVPMLAAWMIRRGRVLIDRADLVVPIPLHWTRRLRRRANQAAELARRIAAETGRTHAPLVLRRTRRTMSQDGKNREARTANIAGALEVAEPDRVAGRHILLIDDVLTTGATLDAAARVLKSAGAQSVDILVIALAVREPAPYLGARTEESEHEDG